MNTMLNEERLIKNITKIICESLPPLVEDKYVCCPIKDDKGMYDGCGWHTDPYHFIAGLAADYLFNLAATTEQYWVLNYVQVVFHFTDINDNDRETKLKFEASSSITSSDILEGKFKNNISYLCNLIAKYLNTYSKGHSAVQFRTYIENKDNTIRKITINQYPDVHQEYNYGGYVIDSKTRKYAVIDVYMDNMMTEEQIKAKAERDRIKFENSPEQVEKRRKAKAIADWVRKAPELGNPSITDDYTCKQMRILLSTLREDYLEGYAYNIDAYHNFDRYTSTTTVADFCDKYYKFLDDAMKQFNEKGWLNPKTKSISNSLSALMDYYHKDYTCTTYDNGLGESSTYYFFDEDGNIADIYDEKPVTYY